MAKIKPGSLSAATAMRDAASELERQAKRLREKADQLEGAGKVATPTKAKPKRAKKAKPAAKAKRARKAVAKAKPARKGAKRGMPAGALKKLVGRHKNGAAHPAL